MTDPIHDDAEFVEVLGRVNAGCDELETAFERRAAHRPTVEHEDMMFWKQTMKGEFERSLNAIQTLKGATVEDVQKFADETKRDIVERLREMSGGSWSVIDDAADEIERLRRAVDKMADAAPTMTDPIRDDTEFVEVLGRVNAGCDELETAFERRAAHRPTVEHEDMMFWVTCSCGWVSDLHPTEFRATSEHGWHVEHPDAPMPYEG